MNHVAEALSRRFSIQRDSQVLSRRISLASRLTIARRMHSIVPLGEATIPLGGTVPPRGASLPEQGRDVA